MRISLIVAADLDGVIGRDGGLPWRLQEDLRRFRRLTLGHPIIMGRKTFESIGKPLPGRTNIVLTGQEGWGAEGVLVARSLDHALELAGAAEGHDEVFIGGGGQVYAAALDRVDRIYYTRVLTHVADGDAFMPELDPELWEEIERQERFADLNNSHPSEFVVLDRAEESTTARR